MKILIILISILFTLNALANEPGWQWYNEKKVTKENDNNPKPKKLKEELSNSEKLELLQKETKERLAKSIIYPNTANFKSYFEMQNYWTDQAGEFTMSAKKTFLEYPELDYNLKHSHYNGTVKNQISEFNQKQNEAVKLLTAENGVLFFYRGGNSIDRQFINVVKNFSETFGVAVLPITIDGIIDSSYPESKINQGQAEKLNVRYFPALILVNPKTNNIKPISYGFLSQDDLSKQFYYVASEFKPYF
ncbi:type-F conjugative transfer system pilin assembly protein TraF [Providencia sp. wls1919]|nr:type-F conjugative transfer system pilin assembly protein TraF [Providencia sp. wls1919]